MLDSQPIIQSGKTWILAEMTTNSESETAKISSRKGSTNYGSTETHSAGDFNGTTSSTATETASQDVVPWSKVAK